MKEDICKTCGAELKWVGSLMDGHVECPNCDGAKINYAGVAIDYAADDGVFYDDCGDLMCTPGVDFSAGSTPDPKADIVWDGNGRAYIDMSTPKGDKLNLDGWQGTETGRRTGKTTHMLQQAVDCMCDCYVIVHNKAMQHYCSLLLRDMMGCTKDRCWNHAVKSPTGCHIRILTVQEAAQPGILIRNRPVLFDHTITYEQWSDVSGYL